MKILHISAECYPAAKAGGLGDVVGALPKYLNKVGVEAAVIMPKHNTKWLNGQQYLEVIKGSVRLGRYNVPYSIEKCKNTSLGFDLYVVNCPHFFDRSNLYTDELGHGFQDDTERWLTFQQAVIHWIIGMPEHPKVLHCHDYHTGLIPFMLKYCPEYSMLESVSSIFTIHNGEYQGAFSWQKLHLLPLFLEGAAGLLDWDNTINPMACAVKCCHKLTTVSPSYMEELRHNSGGMEWLMNNEVAKSSGVLNGIDNQVWNPSTDLMLDFPLKKDIRKYKNDNKKAICEKFGIRNDVPVFTFIGRIVGEKGADLLPFAMSRILSETENAAFIVLGTGDPSVSNDLRHLAFNFTNNCGVALEYNETLAHQLYAGSDFLLMPSRVEPCGLNQMYALRYGTIPIVRAIGGLKDTVLDYVSPQGGQGIRFSHIDVDDFVHAMHRALRLYWDTPSVFQTLQKQIMALDNSWEKSALAYVNLYKQIASI
jgi:starch synthase